jgi:hypothetical protein
MDTDTDRQINGLKKLIATASGDNLVYFNELLTKLLKKKEDEELAKQASKVR